MSKLVGKKFGTLTILRSWYKSSSGHNPKHMVEVECDCGKVYEKQRKGLQKSKFPTCSDCRGTGGVFTETREDKPVHPLHCTWRHMHMRCTNPNRPKYHRYGGRGIKVCDRWSDFQTFVEDMGSKPTPDHSLDRIDNDGNYEPDNCRWATYEEQALNTTTSRMLDNAC